MSNDFYNHTGYPAQNAPGSSSTARSEFDAITVGFALLPSFSGAAAASCVAIVEPGKTGWTTTAGALSIALGKTLTASNTITLAGIDGKTLTLDNSLEFAGTDSTKMTFPSTNATIARIDAGQTFTGTQVFGALTATTVNGLTVSTSTGTLTIANGKTLTASNSITLAGTDGTTITFPTTSATIARTDAANTFGGTQTFGAITATGTVTINGHIVTVNGNAALDQDVSSAGKPTFNGVISNSFNQGNSTQNTWYTAIPNATLIAAGTPSTWIITVNSQNLANAIYLLTLGATGAGGTLTLTSLAAGGSCAAQIDGSGNLQIRQTAAGTFDISANWFRIGQ